MIKKLSQEVINQIAAGEVIERPASVVKELLDNSIDAGGTKITIKIRLGGKRYIEVSDNGCGIDYEDMDKVFEAHSTSKIKDIEDLNNALTMGFRGEALSTIVSVAKTTLISKEKESNFAYKIYGIGTDMSSPEKAARDVGTTIIIENLFSNIPARLKYLRTDSTEYRKILDLLLGYFLIYPNIHFIFFNNDKQVYNLPAFKGKKQGEISDSRIQDVIKSEFSKEMLQVRYEGDGIKITGFLSSPRFNYDKTSHQYFFVNNRLVSDRGVLRSVVEGASGFLPTSKRLPFVLNLELDPSLVDVNVHPRKEEVKFLNPYRVYSAIESAVRSTLEGFSKQEYSLPSEGLKPNDRFMDSSSKKKEVYYKNKPSIDSGLRFSEHLLKPKVIKQEDKSLFKEDVDSFSCSQVFNKYIIVGFDNEMWILDQHAASERIHFEKLEADIETQRLLVPVVIELTESAKVYLKENINVLENFGFKFDVKDNKLELLEIPVNLSGVNLESFLDELLSSEDILKNLSKDRESLMHLISCHASIRSGQKLSEYEMKDLVKNLKSCKNSFSCPHGRPVVWKLTKGEIDKKFLRTY